MKRLRAATSRVAGLFSRERRERAFAEELESHLQLHIDDNLRAGMTMAEARRAALVKLGGVESTKQAYRERSTIPFLEHVVQDVRFAVRQLTKNRGFALTAILVLMLGIGASAAIFGFVDAALVKPLPYRDQTRLVGVTESTAQIPRANLSIPDYLDWKRLNSVFSSLEVYGGRGQMLSTATGTQLVSGARVSDGFFRTLGIVPALGRDFYAGEDLPGAAHTVMLSDASWRTRFGARHNVIGETLTLSGIVYTIVGVLPEDFHFAPQGKAEFWTTLHPTGDCDSSRGCHGLEGVGRLKDGVSVETALANMTSIARQLERQYPDTNRGQGASVIPLSDVIVGDVRPLLLVLLGGAGLLLVIACVNVASLLLVRSESRKRELAVRGALGASPARLVCQFVTEGLVLVAAGGTLGLASAHWAMQLLAHLIPTDMMVRMPYLHGLGVNVRVATFAGVISLIAAALFSIAPTLRVSLANVHEGMSEGSRGSSGSTWHRLGFKLVVLELAIAMVLLVGAGLIGKSFYRLLHVDLGFEPDHLATMQIAIPQAKYAKNEQIIAVARQIIGRIAGMPGVKSVGTSSVLPVSFNGNTTWIRFVGKPYSGEHNEVLQREISAGYLSTLQAKLLRGRDFTDTEDASKPGVVIINEALAKQYFSGEDPIGRRIGNTELEPTSIREVIGIVEDIRDGPLDAEIWPAVYYPFNQSPDTFISVVVRTSQAEGSVLPALSAAIRQMDYDIGTINAVTMSDRINDSPIASMHRSSTWLVGVFATLALLLGVVGLYGVIAYSVSQRTREIGVRLAMGAQRHSVYRLVLTEAGRLTAIGIILGLVCSMGSATLQRKVLFGIPPWDVPTFMIVAAVLASAALLASYLPARRAASVNPIEALRAE